MLLAISLAHASGAVGSNSYSTSARRVSDVLLVSTPHSKKSAIVAFTLAKEAPAIFATVSSEMGLQFADNMAKSTFNSSRVASENALE